MRLEALTVDMVQRAIAIYQELAYDIAGRPNRPGTPGPAGGDPADDPADDPATLGAVEEATVDSALAKFQKEIVETVPGYPCHRYSLRLGNRNYPFMKLLFQEHLVMGEFFFAVDSHDQMEIKPEFPDYEAWMALRKFNRELKQKIEAGLASAGLDTCAVVRRLLVSDERGKGPCSGLVLIVDDEEDLAIAVESLLQARGFKTYKVHDGQSAVAATAELLPDLVLLDYELPELDGLQVIAQLRVEPETARIPILLNSAARVSMADIKKADGFLSKPFPETLLYEMIDRVLKTRREVKK